MDTTTVYGTVDEGSIPSRGTFKEVPLKNKLTVLLLTIILMVVGAVTIQSQNTASAFSETTPIRAAFYYPWYPETENWATQYHPTLGKYDSSDPAVITKHISQAKDSGLDAFIASWWGQGTKTDQRLPLLLNEANKQNFSIAPYYEHASQVDPTTAEIQSDTSYLKTLADANPSWLRVNNKPVLFVYNTLNPSCDQVAKWVSAAPDWYLQLKVFPGYQNCSVQPDSWHQYGPAAATDQQGMYSYTVSPGFYKFNETAPRLDRDLSRFRTNLESMKASGAQWQLITSWNEWGEGTSIESADEWASASGSGQYVDTLRSVLVGDTVVPADVDLTATADSYTREDSAASNYGTAASVYVDASPIRRTYLKFQIPAGPVDAKPVSANLLITANSAQSVGFTVRQSNDTSWTETGINYNNAPPTATSSCGSSGAVTSGQRVKVNLDVSTCLLTGSDHPVTLVLETTSSTNLNLASREAASKPVLHLAYGGTATASPTPTVSATPTPTASATPTPTPTPTVIPTTVPGTGVTKLLVFIEENHSLAQMQAGMPYTFQQAQKYGYANNYIAIRHPSLPNYIAIAGGDTYGIADDNPPSAHPLSGQTVFGQALAAGKTAKTYVDGMPSNCALTDGGTRYAVKHNPWAYFTPSAERTGCQSFDVPVTQLDADITAGTLPNVGMVVPNLCNDAHDCSLSVADNWFKGYMTKIYASPDWQSGRLAVVLTADEDDRNSGNKVLTVVIHPSQNGNVVSTPLTHYSLTRLYEDVAGTSYLKNAATAPSMSQAFGLPIG